MSVDIKTEEQLLQDMLNNIFDEYEKSPGFLTYGLTKTNAIELAVLHQSVQQLIDKTNIDNLSGEELKRYVLQRRGIEAKEATNAKVILQLTGTGTIHQGNLLSTPNNVQFESLEETTITDTGTILAQCTQSGTVGMVGANSITQFPVTLQGFTAVTNPSASYDGFEEESDESIRERYYDDLQRPPTSNNIYHFQKWAKEITGIGDAKVIPTWNGNNTVKVLVIDSNKVPASTELVDTVQEYIDPKGDFDTDTQEWSKWGKGYGESALGSYCTVVSATAKNINIAGNVVIEGVYTIENISQNVTDKLTEYFKSIAFSDLVTYVSYNKIISLILDSEGILDASNITMNNDTINIPIGNEEVAVLGSVVISIAS